MKVITAMIKLDGRHQASLTYSNKELDTTLIGLQGRPRLRGSKPLNIKSDIELDVILTESQ